MCFPIQFVTEMITALAGSIAEATPLWEVEIGSYLVSFLKPKILTSNLDSFPWERSLSNLTRVVYIFTT